MSPVKTTFVQTTFDLETFVHFSKISSVNEPILTKLCSKTRFWPHFLDLKFFGIQFFFRKICFCTNFFLPIKKMFIKNCQQKKLHLKCWYGLGYQNFWNQSFLGPTFFRKRILRINFFGTKLCFLAQPLLRPSSRLTVSAWVSPSSTPACNCLVPSRRL